MVDVAAAAPTNPLRGPQWAMAAWLPGPGMLVLVFLGWFLLPELYDPPVLPFFGLITSHAVGFAMLLLAIGPAHRCLEFWALVLYWLLAIAFAACLRATDPTPDWVYRLEWGALGVACGIPFWFVGRLAAAAGKRRQLRCAAP